jgi:serine/threonine-protein kinase
VTAQLADHLQGALGSDYRVEQELDGGGMSRLFVATDLRHGRRVVVKVLAPELITNTSSARFRREIELTVRLQHPHILPVLTSGAWGDVLYYVAPFIPGESLRARIARDGKLPFDDILRILCDLAGALAFAHQRGVVHRDVKPGNVLLADGHAILADFGIARAVLTTSTPLTGSGMMPGTPAYMAPELPTDESADVYALGVVAYEMLCGALPRRGATARDIIVARGRVAGDDKRRLRVLAEVVADAMSMQPERRIPDAKVLGERLDAITSGARGLPIRPIATAAVLLLAVTAIGGTVHFRRPPPRANAYAVLRIGDARPSADVVMQAVSDAVAEWQGITLADPSAAADLARSKALTLDGAAAIARRLTARNLVGIDERVSGDSVIVRATLYDAAADSAVVTRRAAFATTSSAGDRTMTARRLVNSLVRSGGELPWRDASDHATPNLAAWQAYDAGRAALGRWDLAAATRAFQEAVGRDAQLGLAQLWLAQAIEWDRGVDSSSDLRIAARRAVESRGKLAGRDSIHAFALLALAEGRFDDACAGYASLIAGDSADLAGWLGAADCQAYDPDVVRAATTRTGWAFHGSWEAAARAYERASDLSAAAESPFRGWVLGRMSNILYTFTNHVRSGRSRDADSTFFAGFPELDHDTLAFVPLTRLALARGDNIPSAADIRRAVTRNRELLRHAAEEWVRHAPQAAAAYDSLAAWTELSGGIGIVGERQMQTLDIVRRALALSTDSTERWRLGVSEVRLLVKSGAFDAARQHAESLLAAGAMGHAGSVAGVPGLAALVGRFGETANAMAADTTFRLLGTANGPAVMLPAQVAAAVARLRSFAWLGGPPDSVRAAATHALELIATYFPDSGTGARVRGVTVPMALSFAYPTDAATNDAAGASVDETANAFRLLVLGDSAAARAKLLALHRLVIGQVAGLSIDGNYRRARLAAALGDTALVRAELDPILRAMPNLGPALLERPEQAASLVRALALRADVAARQGDRETARDCARAVVALWKNADAPLQPLVTRMQALAR